MEKSWRDKVNSDIIWGIFFLVIWKTAFYFSNILHSENPLIFIMWIIGAVSFVGGIISILNGVGAMRMAKLRNEVKSKKRLIG